VDGILLNFKGQRHPNAGVWYRRKLSASPTLSPRQMSSRQKSHESYLVTTPLIHRFFANTFGVIQSPFRNRRKYRVYTRFPAAAVIEPTAKADKASKGAGIVSVFAFSRETSPLISSGGGGTFKLFHESQGMDDILNQNYFSTTNPRSHTNLTDVI
jgi:hypothetical protein